MRYGIRFGCRFGNPHDMTILHENKSVKYEACKICNKKFRWSKGFKGRINNVEYLKIHARDYAQRTGPTKRLFNRIYNPEKCTIKI